MQRSDQAEKHRVLIDGVEIDGLVNVGEYSLEKGQIEVPEFKKIRIIQNGISKIAPIMLTYKIKKDSETLKFFREWYMNDETKDVTKIRTDATGTEFARTLYQSCECVRYYEPAFDGAAPTYAQVQVTLAPYEVIPLDAV